MKFMKKQVLVVFVIIIIILVSTLSFAEEVYYKKAMDYFWKGAYKKAIPLFKKAIEEEENLCDAYFYLGLSYINLKKYRDAYNLSPKLIELCTKKIEEDPNDFKAHYYLGYIYELRSFVPGISEYDKAIEEFLIAHEISPKDVNILNHIAFCYLQKKEYQKAIEYLNQAKDLLPNNSWIMYHLGYGYMKMGNKEKAKEYFQWVIDNGEKNSLLYKKAKEMMKKIK